MRLAGETDHIRLISGKKPDLPAPSSVQLNARPGWASTAFRHWRTCRSLAADAEASPRRFAWQHGKQKDGGGKSQTWIAVPETDTISIEPLPPPAMLS